MRDGEARRGGPVLRKILAPTWKSRTPLKSAWPIKMSPNIYAACKSVAGGHNRAWPPQVVSSDSAAIDENHPRTTPGFTVSLSKTVAEKTKCLIKVRPGRD